MLSPRLRSLPACAAAALALSGCSDKPSAPAPLPQAPAPAPQQTVQAQRTDLACAAPIDLPGSRSAIRSALGSLKLGALAGLKDADDDNLAHLRKLVAELRRLGAEVLVADGDLGDNADEQETLLGVLTETGLPVLVAAGNREVRSELDGAEAELRKKGAKLTDLSHTRIVDLGDLLVVGLPGAFDRRQIHADGACVYVQKDLDQLAVALDKLAAGPVPVLLVAAVPPRGQNARALDASDGQNLGDARLGILLGPRRASLGIFGQVWEAGGRAIDAQGAPIAPGAEADQLYLNPGAADKTPWPMSDGKTVAGQAALLSLQGKRASYQVVRLEPGRSR